MHKKSERSDFRLGLLINPYAGLGGPRAQKGSDTLDISALLTQNALEFSAYKRAQTFIDRLRCIGKRVEIICPRGSMGSAGFLKDKLPEGCVVTLLDFQLPAQTSAAETKQVVKNLCKQDLDILVFVGGDGTARDVFDALPKKQVALGIPAGVKMHSSVYAVNPQSAAAVINSLLTGDIVSIASREVRDIDEEAFRRNVVKTRYYGEMFVPESTEYIQQVKQGGIEVDALVLLDIAQYIQEQDIPGTLQVFGPGSTLMGVLENMNIEGTLLGVDVLLNDELVAKDVDSTQLLDLLNRHTGPKKIYITAIGGQGHIIGRGNQQISLGCLECVGFDNIQVVAAKNKLQGLSGRPLCVDSGSCDYDATWTGFTQVLAGYDDFVLYPVGTAKA